MGPRRDPPRCILQRHRHPQGVPSLLARRATRRPPHWKRHTGSASTNSLPFPPSHSTNSAAAPEASRPLLPTRTRTATPQSSSPPSRTPLLSSPNPSSPTRNSASASASESPSYAPHPSQRASSP